MSDNDRAASQLVNRAELAEMLLVDKSTFKVWSNRHPDFPEPVGTDERGAQFYDLDELLTWLDGRKIGKHKLLEDEPVGTTYGDRLRRSAAHRTRPSTVTSAPSSSAGEPANANALIAQLRQWPRSGSGPGFLPMAALALTFLNTTDPTALSTAVTDGPLPQLWSNVCDQLDKAGQRRGISAHLSSDLRTMRPPQTQHLRAALDLARTLGPVAARVLVEQFDAQAELGPTRYVAPAAVSRLMAGCAVGAVSSGPVTLYDPNVRGGELLHAALEFLGQAEVSIEARAADPQLARLAGLSLGTTGRPTTVSTGSSPWSRLNHPFATAVVTNPPFNETLDDAAGELRWSYGTPPQRNGNYAWLQLAVSVLEPGGFAAVLMPAKAGQSTNTADREIRKAMVRAGVVHAVISLPDRLFRPTDLPAAIWVLRSPATAPVRFVVARQAGERTATGRHRLPREVVDDIVRYVHGPSERVGGAETPWQGISVTGDRIEQFDDALEPALYLRSTPTPAPKDLLARARQVQHDVLMAVGRAHAVGKRLSAVRLQPSLPANWKTEQLDRLCDLRSGPTPKNLAAANRCPSGVRVISNKHLTEAGIVHDDADGVRDDIARRMQRYTVMADDVLIVRTGSLGRPVIVDAQHQGYLLGSNLIRLRPYDSDEFDPRFLRIVLGSAEVMAWMRSHSAGTVVHSLGAEQLAKLPVVVPPIADQRAIAEAMQAIDDQITTLHAALTAARKAREHLADGLLSGAVTAGIP